MDAAYFLCEIDLTRYIWLLDKSPYIPFWGWFTFLSGVCPLTIEKEKKLCICFSCTKNLSSTEEECFLWRHYHLFILLYILSSVYFPVRTGTLNLICRISWTNLYFHLIPVFYNVLVCIPSFYNPTDCYLLDQSMICVSVTCFSDWRVQHICFCNVGFHCSIWRIMVLLMISFCGPDQNQNYHNYRQKNHCDPNQPNVSLQWFTMFDKYLWKSILNCLTFEQIFHTGVCIQ